MNEISDLQHVRLELASLTPTSNPTSSSDVRCGRVVSTTGSGVIVLLDDGLQANQTLRMGSLVRTRSQDATVYGIVEGLSTPMPSKGGDIVELHLAEIGLLGEVRDCPTAGESRFRRGVSQVPSLDAVLYLASQDDVKSVYAIPDRSQISVGSLHNDASVPACISIDDLLCKHFALLGTTGVGKSCALTLILTRILEQSPNGHVLLLDPHGEYRPSLRGPRRAPDRGHVPPAVLAGELR